MLSQLLFSGLVVPSLRASPIDPSHLVQSRQDRRVMNDKVRYDTSSNNSAFDPLTVAERSERMSRIKQRDTKPEMKVRRLIHGMGYRYRLHDQSLPGKPDLVFMRRSCVIFVNGCFWHLHDCEYYRLPKSKRDFWMPKLKRNVQRDREVRSELESHGWKHLTIWECELRDPDSVAIRIVNFLEGKV